MVRVEAGGPFASRGTNVSHQQETELMSDASNCWDPLVSPCLRSVPGSLSSNSEGVQTSWHGAVWVLFPQDTVSFYPLVRDERLRNMRDGYSDVNPW